MTSITFHGAAQTVTGSKYLLETDDSRILVDAGLFQGLKELRLRNWQDLPFPADTLDAIVLTHAHLDHVGYLPRIVAQGFRGRIFCTPGTQDLARIVLPDAGRLQEEDADDANRGGYSKHRPALPLYTETDAVRALTLLQPVGYERPVPVAPGVEVEFINAGHLLGSAFARATTSGGTVLFGGDLGRFGRPVLPDPAFVSQADWLLLESTYGDRVHAEDDEGEHLARVVRETAERGGKLVVPSFAIGRVGELIYWLKRLEEEDRIPVLPVYLDSPMAVEALARYAARLNELDPELQPEQHDQKAPLGPADRAETVEARRRHAERERQLCAFCTRRFRAVGSAAESRQLAASKAPAIIISASGMATGGRVLNHLVTALPDPRNTVLFVGFQAAGTRGRRLVDGEASVKIQGRMVEVHATVDRIDSMSAHADSREIVQWLRGFYAPPRETFLVHGEVAAMEALSGTIQRELGWRTRMPEHGERIDL